MIHRYYKLFFVLICLFSTSSFATEQQDEYGRLTSSNRTIVIPTLEQVKKISQGLGSVSESSDDYPLYLN